MEKLEATFRIVTPMFLGGAEHEATSIRPSSVKGVLRFWWRALNWGRFRTGAADDAEALKVLHKEEKILFGSAAEEEGGIQIGGQGCFLLSIKNPWLKVATLTPPADAEIAYLLGQGLYKLGRNAQYLRKAFGKDQEITISIIFKKNLSSNTPANYREQIEKALWLMGLLGGMGSRSRRGFGSLSLEAVTGGKLDLRVPTDIDSYKAVLENLIGDLSTIPEPPFTAFSGQNRIDVSMTGNDPMVVLNAVGREMIFYRSNGRSTTTGDRNILGSNRPISSRVFWADHDLAKDVANGISKTTHPKRIVFGLPHNYLISSANNNKVEIQPIHFEKGNWTSKDRSRRASPLFIHVHKFNTDSYGVVQTFLPAMFLPNNENVEMKQLIKMGDNYKKGISYNVSYARDWNIITDYMDKFINNIGYGRIV